MSANKLKIIHKKAMLNKSLRPLNLFGEVDMISQKETISKTKSRNLSTYMSANKLKNLNKTDVNIEDQTATTGLSRPLL
jgi:hypothetical protein